MMYGEAFKTKVMVLIFIEPKVDRVLQRRLS